MTAPLHPLHRDPPDSDGDAVPRPSRPSPSEIAAWVIVGGAVLYVLMFHLVSALLAGLALFMILDRVSDAFARRIPGRSARPLALLIVALSSAAIVAGVVALAISVIRHSAGRIPDMMNQMAAILESTRAWLGGYGQEVIPDVMTDAENFKAAIADWLKTHAQTVRAAGSYISIGLLRMIMGALLAILVFFRHATHRDAHARGPLGSYLLEKVVRFARVFAQIASAQIKISAVNTSLTALYLLVILPLFGSRLPFTTTLIVLTFLCGLIPVLGNLISNTVITILSLGVSPALAVASLVFLILIHKLEYLINSRIVGGETDSQAWEILMAIIAGEAAFGIGGVILGPIVYAFVKGELRERGLL